MRRLSFSSAEPVPWPVWLPAQAFSGRLAPGCPVRPQINYAVPSVRANVPGLISFPGRFRTGALTPPRTPALGGTPCRQTQGPSPVGLVPPPNPEAVPVLAGSPPQSRLGPALRRRDYFCRFSRSPGPPPMIAPVSPENQCLADATAGGFGLDFRRLRGFLRGAGPPGGAAFALFSGWVASVGPVRHRSGCPVAGGSRADAAASWGPGPASGSRAWKKAELLCSALGRVRVRSGF